MSRLNVLVVGASVAGPTAAYWLARAGANVTVIERFSSLRENGQAIDIRNVGVTVMQKMRGMEEAVRAKSAAIEGFQFVHENGKPFATIKSSGDPKQQTLVSEYEIHRGDLSRILYDMTCKNERIKYVFGEQVTSIQQKEDGPATVEFANGTPKAEYDLVVACDGATGRTRSLGFNSGARDHIIPTNSWVAYFSLKDDLCKGSKMGQTFSAPGGKMFALGADPQGVNRAVLMAINPRNGPDVTEAFRAAMKKGDEALRLHIYDHFKGSGWKSDKILENMLTAEDFYASEYVQIKRTSLSKGRFVTVGDAGYGSSFTGTGSSLALAGAYILAGEVSRHKNDLPAALRSYEERMKPLLDDLQKTPRGMPAALAPQTSFGIWVRNAFIAFVAWTGILNWGGKYFSSAFGDDKHDLPDYEWDN